MTRPFGERERKVRSSDPEGLWGCPTGKRGYAPRSRAKRAAKEARRGGLKITAVYACDLCPGWHLTSQVQRTAARARP